MDNILRVHVKHTMVRVAFLVTVLPLRYVLYPTSLLKISTPMIPHPISSRSVLEDGGRGRLAEDRLTLSKTVDSPSIVLMKSKLATDPTIRGQ